MKPALAIHRFMLATSRQPLWALWRLAHVAFARAAAAYLVRGCPGSAAYVRASLGGSDFVPGLSDVDLALVVAGERDRARASARWQRLRRRWPLTDLVLDYPRVLDDAELREIAGASTLTLAEGRAAYLAPGASPDGVRMLERPGLYDSTSDWQLLAGPDRRPAQAPRDAQLNRIAGWLELVDWWRWVFPVCVDPVRPRSAHLCVKLVSEPARTWLWLAHGERASDRIDALSRALHRLPQEEQALKRALALQASLAKRPNPPLAEVLPVLVRLSSRIAALLAEQIEPAGTSEVELAGDDPLLAGGNWRGIERPLLLPLCDWRSLVLPRRPDATFVLVSGEARDPATLARLAAAQETGPYPALRTDGLLVLPAAARSRARLRALQCRATDPVSFALAAGEGVARFPKVRGWSAHDTARRAVSEHRAWLRAGGPSREEYVGDALGLLLSAARAALFAESLDDAPQLPLTVGEAARTLAARAPAARGVAETALGHYADFAARGGSPPPDVVDALHEVVRALPAYRE